MTLLIDDRCVQLGVTVSDPPDTTRTHWVATHVWLTEAGSWDDVPTWAKPFQNDNLGGDHNVYMLALKLDGSYSLSKDLFVLGWPDGMAKFSPDPYKEGWGDVPINAGFYWPEGNTGPYYAQANAVSSSVVRGLGLPYPGYPWDGAMANSPQPRHYWDGKTYVGDILEGSPAKAVEGGMHTSFFIVMQETEAHEPEPPEPPDDERFDRLLDKAERSADRLVDQNLHKEAASMYLAIAEMQRRWVKGV